MKRHPGTMTVSGYRCLHRLLGNTVERGIADGLSGRVGPKAVLVVPVRFVAYLLPDLFAGEVRAHEK